MLRPDFDVDRALRAAPRNPIRPVRAPSRELKGIHLAMEFLPRTRKACSTAIPLTPTAPTCSAKDKDVDRHRRRRHGDRLRRHLAPTRLPERGPARDHGPCPRGPVPGQSLARVAAKSTSTTTGKRRPLLAVRHAIRATIAVHHQAVRRRRASGRVQEVHTVPRAVGTQADRPAEVRREIPGTRASAGRPSSCCWPWDFSGQQEDYAGRPARAWNDDARSQTYRAESRASFSDPVYRGCVCGRWTCGAGRVWWCGRSMRGAGRA